MNVAIKIYGETERLILRSWSVEDLPLFTAMNKDKEVMKYFPAPLTEEDAVAFYNRIQNEFERTGWGLYAVELKSTGDFIGYVGLHEISFEAAFSPGVEIGWRLSAEYYQLNITIEAMQQRLPKLYCGLRAHME